MNQAIIFDMDGVLINSQPVHYEADKICLREIGVQADDDYIESLAGTTTPNRFHLYQKKYEFQADISKLAQRREEITMNIFRNQGVDGIDGAIKLLKDCYKNGMLTAVASSSPYDMICLILEQLSISKYFKEIVSGEGLEKGKPAPDIFLLTANMLSVSPLHCVVIEDSTSGVAAAVTANMKVIGYKNETSGEQDLTKADLIVDSFEKIEYETVKNL